MYLNESQSGFSGFWSGVGNFLSTNPLGQSIVTLGTGAASAAITTALAPDPPKQSAPVAQPATGGTYRAQPAGMPAPVVIYQQAPAPEKEEKDFKDFIPYIIMGLSVIKLLK